MDSRAVTPVVEKVLTLGIVALFVGGTTTALLGGVVPTYRDAVGQEVGERVLATASHGVGEAVPPDGAAVSATRRVDLPASIRGSSYRLETDGRTLVLDHPHRAVDGRATLAVPSRVAAVNGSWHSGGSLVVTVRSVDDGLRIQIRGESP